MPIELAEDWKKELSNEFGSGYMQKLLKYLEDQHSAGVQIFPSKRLMFNAFNQTPFSKVKVVILGQDPYHGPDQAHGLAFSVQKNVSFPPSLNNIFKELKNDIPGFRKPEHGDLRHWATQGVLLLNTTLSVAAGKPTSHQNRGWEIFTDQVIKKLSNEKKGLIFLLWGKHAQNKKPLIDTNKHYILEAAHPSPLSAHNGFFGCRHFSKTNQILLENGHKPIDWQI